MTDPALMSPSPRVREWQRALAAGEHIELRRSRITNVLLALLMLGLTVLFVYGALRFDDRPFIPWFSAVCALVAFGIFAYRAVIAPPMVVISPIGVRRTDNRDPIPWSGISGTAVSRDRLSRYVRLTFSEQEATRRLQRGEGLPVIIDSEGNHVLVSYLPHGLKNQRDVIALIEIERQRRG